MNRQREFFALLKKKKRKGLFCENKKVTKCKKEIDNYLHRVMHSSRIYCCNEGVEEMV